MGISDRDTRTHERTIMQTSRRAFNAALASLAVGGALAACKGSKGKKITLGFISSWTDGVCMTHFTKVQLEKNGYSTELDRKSVV